MLGDDPQAERRALADPATHTIWRQDIIRFADLDILGHVNNVAYMVFFETGRVAFLEQLSEPPHDREHGPVFVLAHVAADYLAELYYPGTVDIGTSLRQVGHSAFHLGHGIFHDGRCSAIATSVMVHAQGKPLRAMPLSDEMKQRIRAIGD